MMELEFKNDTSKRVPERRSQNGEDVRGTRISYD
jgi:hypothetical protein